MSNMTLITETVTAGSGLSLLLLLSLCIIIVSHYYIHVTAVLPCIYPWPHLTLESGC